MANNSPVPYHLSEQESNELTQAFTMCDTRNSGFIPRKSLGVILKSLGAKPTPSDDDLKEMLQEIRSDSTERITLDEFLNVMAKKIYDDTLDDFRAAFKMFDKTGDGQISPHEFKYVIQHLGANITDEEVEDMIKIADADGNGEIDFDEFVMMFDDS